MKRLRAASEEEMTATPGVPAEVARAVFEYLRATDPESRPDEQDTGADAPEKREES